MQNNFFLHNATQQSIPQEHRDHDAPDAGALQANGFMFETRNLTQQDDALARRRKEVLNELKSQFMAEQAMFIYDNRMGDAEGVSQAIAEGLHARYLYHVQLPKLP